MHNFLGKASMLFLALFIGGVFLALLVLRQGGSFQAASLQEYARIVMEKCSVEKFPPSCYDEELPQLTDRISMEEAFGIASIIQEKDQRYRYCHVLGHNLSSRETAKNPSLWKDVITRCPTTLCNNGCLHGALMERFQSELLDEAQINELKPDLQYVCEPRGTWNPVEIERSMCYHALGHLVMYVTSADIRKSVELCRMIGTKSDGRNYVQTCTEGVFMQIYQPLEPEDTALVKNLIPPKDGVPEFCAAFRLDAMAWHACRREAWALFREEISRPEGLAAFCSYSQNPVWHKICYAALLNVTTTRLVVERDGRLDLIERFCLALPISLRLPETPRELCFAHAARQLVQIDPRYEDLAFRVCKIAEGHGTGGACYETLSWIGQMSFPRGSEALFRFCEKLSQPTRTQCKNGVSF